jgi:competence ComEA-like helix-hairpin-helix protein
MSFFTKQERLVLAVILSVILGGTALQFLGKKYPGAFYLQNLLKEGILTHRVDINTATEDELIAIPFVGPKTAERILDYRKQHGRFENIEVLKSMNIVHERNFEKISRHLKVVKQK